MLDTLRFFEAGYLIIDEYGWRLRKDAPQWAVQEFEEYMDILDVKDDDERECD